MRDYINGAQFAELMDRKGISRDDTVVIYGDKSSWWAAYALWVFTLFGHPDVRLLNGGRNLWIAEGRDTSLTVPAKTSAGYPIVERNDAPIRAYKDDVLATLGTQPLIDVRSPTSTPASARICPTTRRKACCGAATSPRRSPFRGPRRSTRAGGSAAAPSSTSFTASWTPMTRPSCTAASASAPATPGSCSPICWASPGCATTTDPGPSGAIPCGCRSSGARAPDPPMDLRRRDEHARSAGGGGVRLWRSPGPGQARLAVGIRQRATAAAVRPRRGRHGARARVPVPPVPACRRARPGPGAAVLQRPAQAPTTRGFAAILAAGLDEQPASEILAVPEDFYSELGLADLISPLRLRGMSAMLARIKRRLRETV
ncbi:putative thiosulfate sulfurtransferase domain protein [Mycobacterium ulcerans str. Harvey]|uniref:thiosulfate sulfurtransferase n=1 Tax=Mycobacterium ulcerans str. Harvey TaxID=1299332 RepID=A0ABP3ADC1_MYCUL|nr:putative thiosulfate sulfurtransferase domain protein [Mycobacterium ulcerans str. Harvey]